MKLQQAIKSGKPFTRKGYLESFVVFQNAIFLNRNTGLLKNAAEPKDVLPRPIILTTDSILANDWIVKEK